MIRLTPFSPSLPLRSFFTKLRSPAADVHSIFTISLIMNSRRYEFYEVPLGYDILSALLLRRYLVSAAAHSIISVYLALSRFIVLYSSPR